jgi:hypothetical protein
MDLSRDSNEQLGVRWRNAMVVWRREPETPLGKRAAVLLDEIDTERARRSLPGAIEAFIGTFPEGFGDAEFLAQERNDKVKASDFVRDALAEAAFAEPVDYPVVAQNIKRAIGMTNLVQGSFEVPKFNDALKDPANTTAFVDEVGRLLHGSGEAPERLEEFSAFLHSIGLRKWTYGSYLLFLSDPKNCIFVKPESIQKAAETAVFDLHYDPEPTARGYRRILEFAKWIGDHLRRTGKPKLVPEDMIDIQSFIWFVAPTGKWAK